MIVVLFIVWLFVCVVDHVVTEEAPTKKFGDQYREPEPEDLYREPDFREGFEDGKSNLILWCILNPVL